MGIACREVVSCRVVLEKLLTPTIKIQIAVVHVEVAGSEFKLVMHVLQKNKKRLIVLDR
jgi:hypothetical protein